MAQETSSVRPMAPPVAELTVDHLLGWAHSTLLDAARADIDALNVFPVPDGDTGTNLALTWRAASDAIDDPSTLRVAVQQWARGALMGARGNSGVITAQLLRGLALSLADAPVADARALARALRAAADLAYQAVVHPVEGTILTVAEAAAGAAESAVERTDCDVVAVAQAAARASAEALDRTPEQLEVLARAGVVDAGGQGLVLILAALHSAVDPSAPDDRALFDRWGLGRGPGTFVHAARPAAPPVSDGAFEVMYLLDADDVLVPDLRARLDVIGASVVVVGGDGLWNVHVHTDDAGPAVEAGVAVGQVSRIRITPLLPDSGIPTEVAKPGMHRPVRAVVAVASGARLGALFEAVGARVVHGSPGARPTPAQLIAAADGASEVLVLPNDDDHRAVAETAAAELRRRGVTVAVVPTRAAVQGLAALAVHESALAFTDDLVAMTAAAGATRHGAVSRADREAITSAGICQPGDVLGLVEDDIAVIGSDPGAVLGEVVDRMLSAGGELITLVCGDDPWPGRELAAAVQARLHRTRPDLEVVVYDGGQAHYPVLVGVE